MKENYSKYHNLGNKLKIYHNDKIIANIETNNTYVIYATRPNINYYNWNP